MSKLHVKIVDCGARIVVSFGDCDTNIETRFGMPRPSSRPPPFDAPETAIPRSPPLPRF